MSYRAATFEKAIKDILERAKPVHELVATQGITGTVKVANVAVPMGNFQHQALGDIIALAEAAIKRD